MGRQACAAGPAWLCEGRCRRGCSARAVAIASGALVAAEPRYGDRSATLRRSGCLVRKGGGMAERDWRLPQGLLAAIGVVESGRRAPAGMFPMIWPWTINAEGQGYYQPSKAAAVGMVRSLQLAGVRVIDVGCFQVDLYYHPDAFASLEEAFDPDTNARAAARILSSRPSRQYWVGRRDRRLSFGDTAARCRLSAEGPCGLALDQNAFAMGAAGRRGLCGAAVTAGAPRAGGDAVRSCRRSTGRAVAASAYGWPAARHHAVE